MTTLDVTRSYLLTNDWSGYSKQLSTTGDTSLVMIQSASSAHQQWYLTPTGFAGHYRLHTRAKGTSLSLDVRNDNGINSIYLQMYQTAEYTGQFWRFDPWGDGSWRLSNNFTGIQKHLDVFADTFGPHLSDGNKVGQHWRVTPYITPRTVKARAEMGNWTADAVNQSEIASGSGLTVGGFIGIAIGSFVLLLLLAGALTMVAWQIQKYRRRQLEAIARVRNAETLPEYREWKESEAEKKGSRFSDDSSRSRS